MVEEKLRVVVLEVRVVRAAKEVAVVGVLVRGLMLQASEDVGLRARAELVSSAREKIVRAEDISVTGGGWGELLI